MKKNKTIYLIETSEKGVKLISWDKISLNKDEMYSMIWWRQLTIERTNEMRVKFSSFIKNLGSEL